MFDFSRRVGFPVALVGFVLAAGPLMRPAAAAEGGVVWRQDIRQAMEESAREGKPLLIKVTASWCGHCKRMQKTFDDRTVAEHVNAGFIPLLVDADQHPDFVASIGVQGLPATVVMSPDRQILDHITGYRTPQQLDQHLVRLCAVDMDTPPAAHTADATDAQAHFGQGVMNLENAASQPSAAQQAVAQQIAPPPVAFQGCCLVSLLDDKELQWGAEQYTTTYRGVTLAFASQEYKERFEADPERYWPAFDGYCAVSARDFQTSREGLCNLTVIYRGRLWLFSRPDLRRRFISAPQVYAAWAAR